MIGVSSVGAAAARPVDLEERDERGMTSLMNAVCEGKDTIVNLLISGGAKVEAVGPCGFRALHLAIGEEEEEIAISLIDAGADIEAMTEDGKTPLCLAVELGLVRVVRYLLFVGANRYIQSPRPPLNHACQLGNLPIVQLLLTPPALPVMTSDRIKDRAIDRESTTGLRPIHNAAYFGQVDVCRFLLENGADLFTPTGEGRNFTALMGAAYYGHDDVVKLFLDYIEEKDEREHLYEESDEMTAADIALARSKFSTFSLFLDAEMEPTEHWIWKCAETDEGNSCLQKLMDNKCVSDVNEEGETLLLVAVKGRAPQNVRYLLGHRADIEAGFTALKMAAKWGDEPTLEAVLEGNPNLSDEAVHLALLHNPKLLTPLCRKFIASGIPLPICHSSIKRAIEIGAFESLRQLPALGISLYPWALTFAAIERAFDLLKLCLENQPLPPRILHMAAETGNSRAIHYLVGKGAQLEELEDGKGAPLHKAVLAQKSNGVRALLDLGANAEATCTDGVRTLSTLELASFYPSTEIVGMLLHHLKRTKPDTFDAALNGGAEPPLLNTIPGGLHAVAQLLIQYGARPSIVMLHLAISAGRRDHVRIFLQANPALAISINGGYTTLQAAVIANQPDILRDLLETPAILMLDIPDPFGKTPLHYAAACEEEALTRILVEKGASTSRLDIEGQTPIMTAAKFNRSNTVLYLRSLENKVVG